MTTVLREAINDLFLAHKEKRLDATGKQYIIEDHPMQTPWSIVDHMVEQLNIKNDKKILVMFNIEFAAALIETGIQAENITLLANCVRKEKFCKHFGIQYRTEIEYDEGEDMKFDVVVGNPPYSGTQALHQQFFVQAVDLLKDGGEMMFIQPANPYVNNKDVKRKTAEVEMLKLVEKYETHVNIITGKVFDNADLATNLAITHLTKTPGSTSSQYDGGHTYKDVTVNDINVLAIEPKVFANLKSKFVKLVEARGSIQDIVWCDENQLKLRLQKIRGNAHRADFHTFISRDPKYWDSTTDFGIPLEYEGQQLNVASYLKTYVARFALAILKINQHHESGELALTPLVDFDQSWNDEKLCKEFGITDDEYAVIRSVIPAYYEDVK